ncbi:hypothetical protein BGZ95_008398 [Linnemannia exigua]|uniref:SLC41A/MgtE integral membrane domain-containing protein n=1 Tax=Linnemannia exigua TaxID=604196 RepID=A0AAD4DEB5_9FUNG|nr:hypothetical protein BGZ95_008398 [Linnemannia exigua]
MDKLFTASSPFSQANYSPLRNPQEQDQDDDDPESTSRTHRSPIHLHHHHANPQPQQFRHRSHSQSSSRAAIAYSSPDHSSSPHHQTGTFSEGEHDSDSETPLAPFNNNNRFSSGSARNSPSADRSGVSSGAARRINGLRPQSLGSTGAAGIVLQGETIIAVNNTLQSMTGGVIPIAISSSSSSDDEPSSPPPKYTAEDLEYSEPAGRPSRHYGRDEEVGLGFHGLENGQGDGLLMQASTTLIFAVSGLICAGWLLDVIQHWQVFIDISELIILIPILLNLKGNLEMNLASRLSTAANLGLLDQRASRNAFIKGNLGLLQLQSLAVGSVAGLFSFGLGVVVHPTTNNLNEIALMITASMLCAALSSFVLGGFMCGLVLVCRRYRINPDNIACPLASSFGDLVTLVILAAVAVFLQKYINSPLSVLMLVMLLALIPVWVIYVRKNKYVCEVAKEGWGPVFAAMVIASTAGLVLERYINEFPGMALISPVLNGLTGNIGSIYASRISTSLHANVKENYKETEKTLFLVHIPVQTVFLTVIALLGLGHVQWTVLVVLGYWAVALCLVVISLAMAKWITHLFWNRGYDPDNYALPILTSLLDVIGTVLLVVGFWALSYGDPTASAGAP